MSKAIALTDKQTKFVAEFLVDSNGTQAAIRAGYSVSGARVAAHRLLTNDAIYGAIQARQATDATRLSLQREDVLKGLLEAAAMAKLQSDPAGMVASWKQVGLLLGFYAAKPIKMEIDLQGRGEMARFNRLTDAELLKIIGVGQAA